MRVYEPVSTATLKQFRDQKIELPCVVTGISRQISKRNGSEWGRITVEDFSGTATVLAFGDVWDGYHDLLSQDTPVLIRGTVSGRDRDEDAPPIFLDGAVPLASVRTNGTLALEVVLRPDTGDDALSAALAALRSHPGGAPVVVVWDARSNSSEPDTVAPVAGGNGARNGSAAAKTAGAAVRFRSRSLQVAASDALLAELRSVLGAEHIRLVRA